MVGDAAPTDPGSQVMPGGPAKGEDLADCTVPHVPAVPLQRLTQAQVYFAVNDLVPGTLGPGGIDLSVEDLPADEKVAFFSGNLTTLPTEAQVDSLRDVAERLAAGMAARLAQGAAPDLLPCAPTGGGDTACAGAFFSKIGRRAFRRPLAADEQAALVGLFVSGAQPAADGSLSAFYNGLRVALSAMLQSPYFLYHTEFGLAPGSPASTAYAVPLSGYELAARLAFFLWNSVPDDALLDGAAAGELDAADGIARTTAEMLADPRAARLTRSYATQLLGIGEIDDVYKHGDVFPAFDDESYRQAFIAAATADTVDFVDHVIRAGDGRWDTLMAGSSAHLSTPLFAFYGVPRPPGLASGAAAWVQLDPSQRAGLLTRAAFLFTKAHGDQTAPVLRGRLIRESFLCGTVPSPPPSVIGDPGSPSPDETTRQRFVRHESDATCAACHALMDPIGFGLEGFDGTGAVRAQENGAPVDVSGNVGPGLAGLGAFSGGVDLSQQLAASPAARSCAALQWLRLALGRLEADADGCALAALQQRFASGTQTIPELIQAITASTAFRYRRVEGA